MGEPTLTVIGTAAAEEKNYCHTVGMALTGFEDEVAWDLDIATLSALQVDNLNVALPWTELEIAAIKDASDGYQITVELTLAFDSDFAADAVNGMCFGVTPELNGGFCFWWVGTGVEVDMKILLGGMGVQWFPYEYWSGAIFPTTDNGQELLGTAHGLNLVPNVTGANAVTGSLLTGETMTATWY